jgi:nucleoside-diphosphate-sugar epimerase
MTDRALVTGVSGYVGGHVALQLLAAGYIVRGSIRDLKKGEKVRATLARNGADVSRLELVALDLMRDDGWSDAMRDVRYLHHVASPLVGVMPRDPMELIRPAVEGTTRALEAAFSSDVERVVLTASLSCMMYGHSRARTEPFTEADWTNLTSEDINAYIESKTRAEAAAWELARQRGRTNDLVAINPGGIFGPLLDEDPGTTAAVILRLMQGAAPVVPKFRAIVADVRDVAALHVAAMTAPDAGGHRYPVGTATYTLMQIAEVVKRTVPERSSKMPRAELPDWVVRTAALVNAEMRSNLCELGYNRSTDARGAAGLLGHALIDADTTIADTARSMVQQKLI